jgi:hypothetical protein
MNSLPNPKAREKCFIWKFAVIFLWLTFSTLVVSSAQTIKFGPNITNAEPVKNAPFEADYEEKISRKLPDMPVSQLILKGKIYRDSEGKVRKDLTLQSSEGNFSAHMLGITDYVNRRFIDLDTKSKTFAIVQMSEPYQPPIPTPQNPVTNQGSKNKEKESKEIEGVVCIRLKEKVNGCLIETWYSEQLREVVLEKRTCNNEERSLRLFNIRQAEPESQLFKVPSDYKERKN